MNAYVKCLERMLGEVLDKSTTDNKRIKQALAIAESRSLDVEQKSDLMCKALRGTLPGGDRE